MRAQLITCCVIFLTWGTLAYFEWRAPLRRLVEPKLRRTARNLTLSVFSLLVGIGMEAVLVIPVARFVETHQLGLLHLFVAEPWLEIALAVLLLDYTLWWWHWASHRVPFLWRFHLVHHVDRDLDASTALRFHFGEHFFSFFYRSAQIVVFGASLEAVWLWQLILFVSILFHHSNVRLPARAEAALVRLVVTPRMHGIHHSDRRGESFTNYSSLLAVWDYLHRTICLALPQDAVTIGVPAYETDRDVTIGRIMAIPFRRQRDDWQGQTGGRAPVPSSTLAP
ncbi:MAG TPA: sterol desaturase family protein [Thermoanaerobaculia bacterium]|nr:sterol desaturase family protein [Thermoanaerobaculia bacterium]